MRALRLDSAGTLILHDTPRPAAAGECLVRVTRAGICGTDLQMLAGYAEFRGTPGHEFAGVVEAADGSAGAAWIGRRVVGEINVGCGRCAWCARGVKEHCEARSVLGIRGRDGAFADYLTLPASNLHEIPPALDDETAVFVEPVAAACRILEQIRVDPDSRVAVLGDGRMGLLVAQVLRTAAARVSVLGRHEEKLQVARALGIDARSIDTVSARDRYDVVVDVTGRAEGLQRAIGLARPLGTVILKSTFHGDALLSSWPVVVHEVTLIGSRCGPFARALDLLAAGHVDVRPLIARVLPLEEFAAAFEQARRSLKVLFRMTPS